MSNQPKITAFNAQNLKQLEKDIEAALAKVSADYGIPITFKGGRGYTQSGWNGKVEVALSNKVVETENEMQSYRRAFELFYGDGHDI